MFRFLRNIFRPRPEPGPCPGVSYTHLVADSDLNRSDPFWSQLIGGKVYGVSYEADGLLSFQVDKPPYRSIVGFHGIKPERITPLTKAHHEPR